MANGASWHPWAPLGPWAMPLKIFENSDEIRVALDLYPDPPSIGRIL